MQGAAAGALGAQKGLRGLRHWEMNSRPTCPPKGVRLGSEFIVSRVEWPGQEDEL